MLACALYEARDSPERRAHCCRCARPEEQRQAGRGTVCAGPFPIASDVRQLGTFIYSQTGRQLVFGNQHNGVAREPWK